MLKSFGWALVILFGWPVYVPYFWWDYRRAKRKGLV